MNDSATQTAAGRGGSDQRLVVSCRQPGAGGCDRLDVAVLGSTRRRRVGRAARTGMATVGIDARVVRAHESVQAIRLHVASVFSTVVVDETLATCRRI